MAFPCGRGRVGELETWAVEQIGPHQLERNRPMVVHIRVMVMKEVVVVVEEEEEEE